jgi:hypothetical protein
VGAADVALKERLVKPPDAYEPGQYPHAEAAKVLEREFGRATGPGYHMRYFVAKGLGKAVAPRALPLERFSPDAVDAAYYIEKLEERVGIIEDMAFPRPRPVQSTLLGF